MEKTNYPYVIMSLDRGEEMEFLSGNEAIARGAYEGGVVVGSGYPGTPSSEILENLANYDEVYSQWSPNEKVALEVGIGASLGGARTLVVMKHVGLNVAADPFFTLAYTGVNAGLVIITADDPGMYSSQNEQDNRYYARAANVPMLEPSDSQEAKDFVPLALDISEKFDTPVLLRITTRISHTKTLVKIDKRREINIRSYEKNIPKYVMLPQNARKRHQIMLEKLNDLAKYVEKFPHNIVEEGEPEIGIIASGVVYQHAKEVFSEASFLKLGMTHPLPKKLIETFVSTKKNVYVIEELEPILEKEIKSWGIEVLGKEFLPRVGELNPDKIRRSFSISTSKQKLPETSSLPPRPPLMCPGCPHRGIFYVLNKLKLTVMGDIGCYTLGALPPFQAMDTCICMGAGIGSALGFEKASLSNTGKAVAVIGDSTFVHSGITSLIDVVYNKGSSTIIILDNRITAMTGRQNHPGTGITLKGEKTKALNFEKLAKAVGVESVKIIDPYNLKETENIIKEEVKRESPSVIISSRPCVLIKKVESISYYVDNDICISCDKCFKLGCPAISKEKGNVTINPSLCTGCGLCAQVCISGSIKRSENE